MQVLNGAAQPQIGSCIRARWSHNLPDKRQLQTAFAIEAVVDEAVQLFGEGTSRDYTYIDDIVKGVLAAYDRVGGRRRARRPAGPPRRPGGRNRGARP